MNTRVKVIIAGVGLVSAGIGYLTGVSVTRDKLQKEYEASARAYKNAVDKMTVEAPVATEEDLLEGFNFNEIAMQPVEEGLRLFVDPTAEGPAPFEPESILFEPQVVNPYHSGFTPTETPSDVFLSGEVNIHGISYLEEEEYLEEDGRFKGVVTLVMDPNDPKFFMAGEELENWAECLGPSIITDFMDYVPSGTLNPVLYVRNNKTDCDYSVSPELP